VHSQLKEVVLDHHSQEVSVHFCVEKVAELVPKVDAGGDGQGLLGGKKHVHHVQNDQRIKVVGNRQLFLLENGEPLVEDFEGSDDRVLLVETG
jgi:hypothetical protein